MNANITEARSIFANAIANGATEAQAAQQVWEAMRPKNLRAKCWDESYSTSKSASARRAYRCPLGDLLGVTEGERGWHSARWPRTKRSIEECENAAAAVLAALRGE